MKKLNANERELIKQLSKRNTLLKRVQKKWQRMPQDVSIKKDIAKIQKEIHINGSILKKILNDHKDYLTLKKAVVLLIERNQDFSIEDLVEKCSATDYEYKDQMIQLIKIIKENKENYARKKD